MNEGQLVLVAGALLAAGLLASLVAGRLRVPSLLLFLGVGMLIGSDGFGWIDFADYELSRVVGIIALALILFEGGLASGWHEIRPVFVPAFSLATVGTLVTAVIVGFGASLLFDMSTLEGLLIGAIVSSTDGAAIFAVLRGSTLRRRLARTLEGEAGMNDPVAVLLVLGFIEWIQEPDYNALDMLVAIARELAIGAAVGLLVGVLAVRMLREVRLASAGLYPVASLAFAALAFGGADVLHGSGFLAVYLPGLVIGTVATPARRTITTFHDGLAWVAQLGMFLVLGLLVFPSDFGGVWLEGIILALVLIVVARPIATFVATVGMGFTVPERVALGWAGLRGAVPVVLATFPVIEGVRSARVLRHRLLRRARVHAAAGDDLRVALGEARRDDERGGDPDAADRAGDRAPAGRGDRRVPDRQGRRGGGPPRARAGPAARGAPQPDHPGRPGDPAARLDARGGGRPAPRARAHGGGDRVPRALERWRNGPVGPRRSAGRSRTARSSRAARGTTGKAIRAARSPSTASRWSSSCGRDATAPERSSRSPTAATRSPVRSWLWARRSRCRSSPAGAWGGRATTPSAPGGAR